MYSKDIGIRIISYRSIGAVVKIVRKYTGQSISEIKSAIDKGECIFTGNQCSEDDLKSITDCYKELIGAEVNARLCENGREIPLQFLLNLRESLRETSCETEAEAELEGADMEALEEYCFLWTNEQDNWVVIKEDSDYTIYDRKNQRVLLIEDEDINNQAAAMMIMHGCRVVSRIPGQQ